MKFTSDTQPHNQIDPDDLENNTSGNPSMHDVLAARMHRRHVLKGGVGAMTMAGLGTLGLSACSTMPGGASAEPTLGFRAVNKSLMDRVTVPDGYTATVIYATGDPLDASVGDYKNDGTDASFARRAGEHHDSLHYFGMNAEGMRDNNSLERALLVVNHENITGTVKFMHPAGQTNNSSNAGPRPEAEVIKEIEAQGVSVVELRKTNGKYGYVKASSFNRRITGATPMELSGPARGSAYMKTVFSPNGTQTRGTINNCAHGVTPWAQLFTVPRVCVPFGEKTVFM